MTLRLVVSNSQTLSPGTIWIGDDGPTEIGRLLDKVGDQRTAVSMALHRLGWIRLVRDADGLEIRCDPRAVKANPLCLVYAAALLGGEPVAIASGIKAFRCFAFSGHGWLRIESATATEAVETLYRLLEMVDPAPSVDAEVAKLEGLAILSPSRLVMDTKRRRDLHGLHLKAYLGEEAVAIDPQLRFVQRYCDRVRNGDVLRERDINLSLLRERVPDCALHVYALADDPEKSYVENWLPMADYRESIDLNNATLEEIGPGLGRCIGEDVHSTVEQKGECHWTMMHRTMLFQEASDLSDRSWLRVMIMFMGSNDRPKVLLARRLKDVQTVQQYFSDLRAG